MNVTRSCFSISSATLRSRPEVQQCEAIFGYVWSCGWGEGRERALCGCGLILACGNPAQHQFPVPSLPFLRINHARSQAGQKAGFQSTMPTHPHGPTLFSDLSSSILPQSLWAAVRLSHHNFQLLGTVHGSCNFPFNPSLHFNIRKLCVTQAQHPLGACFLPFKACGDTSDTLYCLEQCLPARSPFFDKPIHSKCPLLYKASISPISIICP